MCRHLRCRSSRPLCNSLICKGEVRFTLLKFVFSSLCFEVCILKFVFLTLYFKVCILKFVFLTLYF